MIGTPTSIDDCTEGSGPLCSPHDCVHSLLTLMFKRISAALAASVASLSFAMPAKAGVGVEEAVTVMSATLVRIVENYNEAHNENAQPPQIILTRAARVYGGCINPGEAHTHYTGYGSHHGGSHWCRMTNTMIIDYGQAETFHRSFGDGAVAYIVAHEFAHYVQGLDNIRPRDVGGIVPYELQADCIAGGILRSIAPTIGWDYNDGDNHEVLAAASSIGDSTHGSGQQRKDAVMKGFNKGIEACEL